MLGRFQGHLCTVNKKNVPTLNYLARQIYCRSCHHQNVQHLEPFCWEMLLHPAWSDCFCSNGKKISHHNNNRKPQSCKSVFRKNKTNREVSIGANIYVLVKQRKEMNENKKCINIYSHISLAGEVGVMYKCEPLVCAKKTLDSFISRCCKNPVLRSNLFRQKKWVTIL